LNISTNRNYANNANWQLEYHRPKKKQTFQPGNAHFTVKLPAVEMFFSEKRVCELSMFPQYMQTYYGILCFSRVKKLHTALLITIHC